jgi:copper chaperone
MMERFKVRPHDIKEPGMLTLQVNDMSCGHCVRAIKDVVRGLDAGASVDVDLGRRLVRVQSDHLDAPRLHAALVHAGYTPDDVAATQAPSPASADCCGCASARCGCGS